jgi:hypothetical protein
VTVARPTWTLTGPLSAPHGAVLAGTELTLSLVPGVSRDPSGSDLRAGSTVAVVGADGTLTVKGTGDPAVLLASSPDAPVHYRLSCIPRVLPTVTFTAPEGGTLALDDIVPEVPAPIPPVDASTLRAEWQAALAALVLGVTDHGALTGLGEDDHTQYALADGTRGAFAAPLGADDNYVTDAEKSALHAHSNKAALDLVSGTNTGDQVLPTWSTISGKPAVVAEGATQADARTNLGLDTAATVGALPIPDPGSFYPTDTITAALQLIGGRERYGTDSPEGVVTAPVGTYYTDTAITNGAMRWAKKTGTGNTGWQCIEGDTGWRAITSWTSGGVVTGQALTPSWAPTTGGAGNIRVRRINNEVLLGFRNLNRLAGADLSVWAGGYVLPAGFRPSAYTQGTVFHPGGVAAVWWGPDGYVGRGTGQQAGVNGSYAGPGEVVTRAPALADVPWPTSLPGTAA